MNIIAIDPSLTCTAMIVNDRKFIYCSEDLVLSKTQKLTKWFEICSDYISYRTHSITLSNVHSDDEYTKLLHYQSIVEKIILDIKSEIEPRVNSVVVIEGYSYSSTAGPLIDLVTFGTLLRHALVVEGFKYQTMSPSTTKLEAAKLSYSAIKKGKKVEYRNNEGISGGKFKKPDMYKCLLDNKNLSNDAWVNLIREYSDEILSSKKIPKPIEDMNDAKLIYEIVNGRINKKDQTPE